MNNQEKINEYYKNIVANSSNCKKCIFNHNGICFFAIECISHNFNLTKQVSNDIIDLESEG